MSEREPLGELLRAHRTAASLTLEMLAERSGISDRTISNIERGASRSPQQHTLQALAKALGLDEAQARSLYQASAARRGKPITSDRSVSIAPARLPDFTGRVEELALIVDRLRTVTRNSSSIVVISGSPGIGKTATAVEAVRRAGGDASNVLFVDLSGLATTPLTPLQALQSLLQQVQNGVATLPRSLDQAATMWRKASSSRKFFILFDNAANEEQVRPVIAATSAAAIIVTSRRTLSGLEGVARLTLQPLASDEGAQLLGRIIPASQRGDGDLPVLAKLCADVPLALRIAGNRVASQPGWSTSDFIDRMREEEKRLRVLTAGDLGVAAAFQSSYGNLRRALQDLYRSLPLIEGPTFDARMASAIIPGHLLETEDMLDELTDLGLLEARGSTRYRLHDLARLYAAERLNTEADDQTREERRSRLRHWLLRTASRAGQWFEPQPPASLDAGAGLEFMDAEAARAWLHAEVDNWFPAYREAAALGEREWVLLVADSLHWFSDLWLSWGHWKEVFNTSVAAAKATGDELAQAIHFGYLAWAEIIEQADFKAAVRAARQACDAADRSGDPAQRGWSRYYLAWALEKRGDLHGSISAGEAALSAFQRAGDREGILQAATLTAWGYHKLGSTGEAIAAHQALLRQIDETPDTMPPTIARFTRTSVEQLLAEEYLAAGQWKDAAAFARSSLEAAREIDYPNGGFASLLSLAHALAMSGDLHAAWQAYGDAEVVANLTPVASAEGRLKKVRDVIEDSENRRPQTMSTQFDEAS